MSGKKEGKGEGFKPILRSLERSLLETSRFFCSKKG